MTRISGDGVRRVVAAAALFAVLPLAGCGGAAGKAGEAGDTAASASPSGSASPGSEQPGSGEPGSNADGECGGGEFETQVVKAAQKVDLTVPATWRLRSTPEKDQFAFLSPQRELGDGFLVVEEKSQTLQEALDDALEFTAESATTTSEQDLDLPGFDAAKVVTFEYDDLEKTFAVDVVAVVDGVRVVASMTREGVSDEQVVAESCLSTLSRTS